jgi:hypothetical protein
MNKKKALMLIMAIQMILLLIQVALFVSGIMNITAFVFTVLVVGIVCMAATIMAVRKLPPM